MDSTWRCAICLHGGFQVRRLACGHAFHGACVVAWLRRGRHCPLGRCPVAGEVLAAVRRQMDFGALPSGARRAAEV